MLMVDERLASLRLIPCIVGKLIKWINYTPTYAADALSNYNQFFGADNSKRRSVELATSARDLIKGWRKINLVRARGIRSFCIWSSSIILEAASDAESLRYKLLGGLAVRSGNLKKDKDVSMEERFLCFFEY
ncbi:hypothetical protein NC651_012554 [Populus alba x Populus x berolinensis]|nr:hypothetical protein NC651_012554 [Populus alba x Populus x berolinensis]